VPRTRHGRPAQRVGLLDRPYGWTGTLRKGTEPDTVARKLCAATGYTIAIVGVRQARWFIFRARRASWTNGRPPHRAGWRPIAGRPQPPLLTQAQVLPAAIASTAASPRALAIKPMSWVPCPTRSAGGRGFEDGPPSPSWGCDNFTEAMRLARDHRWRCKPAISMLPRPHLECAHLRVSSDGHQEGVQK
jgi:hypothetical protein